MGGQVCGIGVLDLNDLNNLSDLTDLKNLKDLTDLKNLKVGVIGGGGHVWADRCVVCVS